MQEEANKQQEIDAYKDTWNRLSEGAKSMVVMLMFDNGLYKTQEVLLKIHLAEKITVSHQEIIKELKDKGLLEVLDELTLSEMRIQEIDKQLPAGDIHGSKYPTTLEQRDLLFKRIGYADSISTEEKREKARQNMMYRLSQKFAQFLDEHEEELGLEGY